jgi:hypothetical protein
MGDLRAFLPKANFGHKGFKLRFYLPKFQQLVDQCEESISAFLYRLNQFAMFFSKLLLLGQVVKGA